VLGLPAMPDGLLDEDARMVRHAAAVLQLPEFGFFHLAHRRWFGHPASDREIEPHFVGYLFGRRIPMWVRHLAREVIERSQRGPMTPQDYGVEPVLPRLPVNDPAEPARAALLALVYGACFLLVALCAL